LIRRFYIFFLFLCSGLLYGQADNWSVQLREAEALLNKDVPRAARIAEQAYKIAKDKNDVAGMGSIRFFQGDLARFRRQDIAAKQYYNEALTRARQANLDDLIIQSLTQLQLLAAGQGRTDSLRQLSNELSNEYRKRGLSEANQLRIKLKEAETTAAKDAENYRRNLLLLLGTFAALLLFLQQKHHRAKRRIAGELAEKNALVEDKRRRSEQLLLNILPKAVAAELTYQNKVKARRYERATVMFVDFASFTRIAEELSPERLVEELDYCFSHFDSLLSRQKVEKIKTAGDAYICASGLSDHNERPHDMIRMAQMIQAFLIQRKATLESQGLPSFRARIGIHFGPVVAGVVGSKKFAYDIWGDTVNVAARLEETCEPGRINVSHAVYAEAKDDFEWESRGHIDAKNKDAVAMYYVGMKLNKAE
jgi:class 3 adenylate cyclase